LQADLRALVSDESQKREKLKQSLTAVEGRVSTQLSGVNRQLKDSQGKLQQLSDALGGMHTQFVTAESLEEYRTSLALQIDHSEKVITAVSEMMQERRKGAPQLEKTLLEHSQALREMAEGKMDRSEFRSNVGTRDRWRAPLRHDVIRPFGMIPCAPWKKNQSERAPIKWSAFVPAS
jgi:hypothetical protein